MTSKKEQCLKKVKNEGDMCPLHSKGTKEKTTKGTVTKTNMSKLMRLLAQMSAYDFDDTKPVISQFDDLVNHAENMVTDYDGDDDDDDEYE